MHVLFEQSELRDLIEKVEKGERLDDKAGVRMMNSQDILAVGYMANLVRERKNGSQTGFMVNGCSDPPQNTKAVMRYGLNESPEEQIGRLVHLRELQDQTKGFLTFAPLPFYPEHTKVQGTMGTETTTGFQDLKMLAIARIMLDNFEHIRGSWVLLGFKLAQVSLAFGVDDLDDAVAEENRAQAVGTETSQVISKRALIEMIQKAGRDAVERKG